MAYIQKAQNEIVNQRNLKKTNELQQELVSVIKKLETYSGKESDLESEISSTKKKVVEQQKYMKDLDERSVKLKSEYIQLLEKQNSGKQERVNVQGLEEKVYMLQSQISEIEDDNKLLKDKLDTTNTSVGSFIRDMNGFLDSHELTATLNMEVESEEDEETAGR